MPLEIASTTVFESMLGSMERTHELRRISVYAGPPGIGKTTAIEAFADSHGSDVIMVEPFTRKTTARGVYHAMTRDTSRFR